MFELYILVGLMIFGAILAIEIRSLLSSVVSVGIIGFTLCIIFLILRAPDAALAQLIVEVIALVVLIRATGIQQDDTERPSNFRELFAYISVIFFITVFTLIAFYNIRTLLPFGQTLMPVSKSYLSEGMKQTGVPNLVTGILLDYRALDMLAAIGTFFGAAVGVVSIMRIKGRKEKHERDDIDS